MKREWIDVHIHISDIGKDGKKRLHFIDDLAALLDSSDANLKMIVSADGPYGSPMKTNPEAILAGNSFIHDVTQALPGRVFGACFVNTNFYRESLDTMNKCFGDWGFLMFGEMLGYSMGFDMASENCVKLVRRAAEFNVPVQVHLATYCIPSKGYPYDKSMDGIGQLADMIACVRQVPEAKYIMAHAIGCAPDPTYIPWANMFLDSVLGTYGCFPDNFWLEIRDFNCPALARTLRDVPHEKLLSGTDWTTRVGPPFAPYGTCFEAISQGWKTPFVPSVATFTDFLRKAGATEDDIDMIGSLNPRNLFQL